MANIKITEYAELAAPISTDVIEVVSDPGGTPISKKVQIRNLFKGGGQIAFPATAVPSADPNTLDDYEEGTWTADYQGTTGSAGTSATGSNASYTKIGNLVFITSRSTWNNVGSWTGTVKITGLPFALTTFTSFYSSYTYHMTPDTISGYGDSGNTFFDLIEGGGTTKLAVSDCTPTCYTTIAGSYRI